MVLRQFIVYLVLCGFVGCMSEEENVIDTEAEVEAHLAETFAQVDIMDEGLDAKLEGKPASANPYQGTDADSAKSWLEGWTIGMKAEAKMKAEMEAEAKAMDP